MVFAKLIELIVFLLLNLMVIFVLSGHKIYNLISCLLYLCCECTNYNQFGWPGIFLFYLVRFLHVFSRICTIG